MRINQLNPSICPCPSKFPIIAASLSPRGTCSSYLGHFLRWVVYYRCAGYLCITVHSHPIYNLFFFLFVSNISLESIELLRTVSIIYLVLLTLSSSPICLEETCQRAHQPIQPLYFLHGRTGQVAARQAH